MTAWPNIQIGRLVLRETAVITPNINTGSNRRTLAITGQESCPPRALGDLKLCHEDILGLNDQFLPIVFANKSDHNGWYYIRDVNTSLTNWNDEAAKFDWTLQCELVGAEGAVDVESRGVFVDRANDFSLGGSAWHAPAGGALGYYTGTTQPSLTVVRVGSDGTVNTYTGVPTTFSPRWACTLAGYQIGRARILTGTTERSGDQFALATTGWEMNNSLVKVVPNAATSSLRISVYDGTQWEATDYKVMVGGIDLVTFDAATVLRNDYEGVAIRLVKSRAPGRTLLDLVLRRGSRFVEGYLTIDTSSTLAVARYTAQAHTNGTSHVVATANDAAGNRSVIGSARSFTADLTQGGISKAAVTALDFFVGAVVNATSPLTGDAATDLRNQYLKVLAEQSIGTYR